MAGADILRLQDSTCGTYSAGGDQVLLVQGGRRGCVWPQLFFDLVAGLVAGLALAGFERHFAALWDRRLACFDLAAHRSGDIAAGMMVSDLVAGSGLTGAAFFFVTGFLTISFDLLSGFRFLAISLIGSPTSGL